MKKLASLALAAVLTAALSIPATASFDRSYTAPKGTPVMCSTRSASS